MPQIMFKGERSHVAMAEDEIERGLIDVTIPEGD